MNYSTLFSEMSKSKEGFLLVGIGSIYLELQIVVVSTESSMRRHFVALTNSILIGS